MEKNKADERPTFFATQADFRQWLDVNHEKERVLWVGYYKKATGIPSITWPESVDEALCFGWIDGIRKSVDDQRYKIRFTPRKPTSIWSAVNIRRIEELKAMGTVTEAGLAAYARRKAAKSKKYSYEQKRVALSGEYEAMIRDHSEAWDFFNALAPSYKRATIWWVMSAKRRETQLRRLKIVIESSAAGLKVPPLRRSGK